MEEIGFTCLFSCGGGGGGGEIVPADIHVALALPLRVISLRGTVRLIQLYICAVDERADCLPEDKVRGLGEHEVIGR